MMKITVEDQGSISIVHLNGKLFIESINVLLNTWEELIAKQPKVIAIDCSKLTSIDSSSIGTLVRFFNETMNKNIELVFFDLNPSIRKLFYTIHLEKFFSVITGRKFETDYLQKLCSTAG
ncbi:MAG TPA: STAS domain-containing protein [Spirochaetota bacterium]|nr:STAS domain-containing protein [Spirochaetota bacterium]